MNNIIRLLAVEYYKKRKEYNSLSNNSTTPELKKARRVEISLLGGMILGLISLIISENTGNMWLFFGVGIALYITCLIILIKYVDKLSVIRSKENNKKHYASLNILRNIMRKDFHVYSKDKVVKLINECDKEIELLNSKNRLIKTFEGILKISIGPLLAFASAAIKIDSLSKKVNGTIIISSIIYGVIITAFTFGILWVIEKINNIGFKEDKKRIVKLRNDLNDLYLKNFV